MGRAWRASSHGSGMAWVKLSRGRVGYGRLGVTEAWGRRLNAGRSHEVERACVACAGERVPRRSGLLLGGSELVGN